MGGQPRGNRRLSGSSGRGRGGFYRSARSARRVLRCLGTGCQTLGDRHWAERLGKRVVEQTGADVSADFRRGAELTLAFAHRHGIRLAVLKEKSPSCGVNIIYDGSFSGQQIAGEGVVAALLRQHGIQVFSEHELERVQPWLEVH